MRKSGLGRGLGALLEGVDTSPRAEPSTAGGQDSPDVGGSVAGADVVSEIPLDDITRGTYQPRVHFDEQALQELADSIAKQGLVQPVLLRRRGGGYELVAGERRWRAARMAGLQTIPAIVREMDDGHVAAVTLIENIQREDLNPLEEARALQRLQTEFEMTHQQVAESVGRSRTAVTNLLRLLDLDERVAEMLASGRIEMGHARALLSLAEDEQHLLALRVYAEGLSVRATEQLVRGVDSSSASGRSAAKKKTTGDSHVRALENRLSDQLGAKVSIAHSATGKGVVKLAYNSLDELDGILAHIK